MTMKSTLMICIALAVLMSQTQALPSYMARFASRRAEEGENHEFRAPTATDERSPCPMLNTLANHGYLPRTGKGLTPDGMKKAFVEQLGTSSFFGGMFASIAFKKFANGAPAINMSQTWLTLEKGGIEHVASLTRGDHTLNSKPDKARLEKELGLIKKTKDEDIISIKDLADIRKSLEADSKDEMAKTPKAGLIGAAEACLLHGVAMGDANGLKVGWFRSILEEEKFPADWKKSKHILNTGYGLINLTPCLMGLEWDKKWSKADLAKIPYTEEAKDTKSFF